MGALDRAAEEGQLSRAETATLAGANAMTPKPADVPPGAERFRRGLIGIAVVVLIAAAGLAVFGFVLPRRRAHRLLAATSAIQFSRTDRAGLVRLLGQPDQADDADCDRQACTLVWIANNSLLHWLRLAPPTAINVGVMLMGGTAQAVWTSLASRDRAGNLHGAMLTLETERNLIPDAPATGGGRVPDYVTFSAVVRLSQAPRFPVSPACLVHRGGCRNAADVLPWVNWPAVAAGQGSGTGP